jgi:hypothetical protein
MQRLPDTTISIDTTSFWEQGGSNLFSLELVSYKAGENQPAKHVCVFSDGRASVFRLSLESWRPF